ncbi:MAG: hypothetical protein U0992_22625 [Planctomycetaceae bacterium]
MPSSRRSSSSRSTRASIEEADLKTIYFLDAAGQGIKDLTGLEKCTNRVDQAAENEIESAGRRSRP